MRHTRVADNSVRPLPNSADKPAEASVGVRSLLVGGTVIIDQGAVVTGVTPGRALLRGRKD